MGFFPVPTTLTNTCTGVHSLKSDGLLQQPPSPEQHMMVLRGLQGTKERVRPKVEALHSFKILFLPSFASIGNMLSVLSSRGVQHK